MSKTKSSVQPYDSIKISRKEIVINNFLGGVSWAVGTTVGLTVVVTFLGFIFKQIGVIPIIGGFITQLTDFVMMNSRQL